jgi:hypothetical protein
MWVDSNDNIYYTDAYRHVIRKIDNSGIVRTIAGQQGIGGYLGSQGSNSWFHYPTGIHGNNQFIIVADSFNHVLRKIELISGNYLITAIVGCRFVDCTNVNGDPGKNWDFMQPRSVTIEGNDLYITDVYNSGAIWRTDLSDSVNYPTSMIYGSYGFVAGVSDISFPAYLYATTATDGKKYVYVAEGFSSSNRIFRLDVTNPSSVPSPTLIAGVYINSNYVAAVDGVDARNHQILGAKGIVVDETEQVMYFTECGSATIRTIDMADQYRLDTYAGVINSLGHVNEGSFSGDGGPATSARLWYPTVLFKKGSKVYVMDSNNYRIRMITHTDGFIGTGNHHIHHLRRN